MRKLTSNTSKREEKSGIEMVAIRPAMNEIFRMLENINEVKICRHQVSPTVAIKRPAAQPSPVLRFNGLSSIEIRGGGEYSIAKVRGTG